MRRLLSLLALAAVLGTGQRAMALGRIRFVVVDPATLKPVQDAIVTLEDLSGRHAPVSVCGTFDVVTWLQSASERVGHRPPVTGYFEDTTIVLALNQPLNIQAQDKGQVPTKEIYIKVTATRIRGSGGGATQGTTRTGNDIRRFATGGGAQQANSLVQGQAGVASDSSGQQHVRGEHAEITYVVDGVPLPDTLSGRQGAIVVPSTVDTLEIIEGGFAPEFGGQTAAILNVATNPGSKKFHEDVSMDGGSYNTFDGDLTAVGPLGGKANFVVDVQGSRTGIYDEPQQPNLDSAHNTGSYYSAFAKVRLAASPKDALTLTLSHNPDKYQDGNRTGLPSSFADVGQGYGFLGLRDANGTIPNPINPGGLGSGTILLPSQQGAGMDINSTEINEFATLNWRRQLDLHSYAQMALTALHSGDEVSNRNPSVNPLNLPVDSAIEYNPNVVRNIHHLQATGSVTSQKGAHDLKAGFLIDRQTGHEMYQIWAASQLALDELANLDPTLAPSGAVQMSGGKPVLDVNGNPIFKPASPISPSLYVSRQGWYDAAYVQDTWKVSKRFTVNYGFRYDWYNQNENLQKKPVSKALISPRVNFSYDLDKRSIVRWSYNKLFDTPPLAQGAIVGAPIVPETIDQYDASVEHDLGRGQDVKLAYYAKLIRNQVDTGLLIPGSQIGLFSAVNFEFGGVHGVEFSYDISAPKGVGWDGYFNTSYSKAAPNGVDNTGAKVPQYNDHDQRLSVGAGLAYTFNNQSAFALTVSYGSGLASSIIRDNHRNPRSETDLKYTSSPKLFGGHGGFGIGIENLFDDHTVINFESGFSGTRFMEGRRLTLSLFASF